VGTTLRQSDLRRRLGVAVLYLRRGENGPQIFPDPDLVLLADHRLIVLAEPGSLQQMAQPVTPD
jgi:Trk K+ transport system NAD-binding subunit